MSDPQNTFVNFMQATGQAYAAGGASATEATFYFLGGDENTLTVLDAMVVSVRLDLTAAPGAPTNMSFVPQVCRCLCCCPIHHAPRHWHCRCRTCRASHSRRCT